MAQERRQQAKTITVEPQAARTEEPEPEESPQAPTVPPQPESQIPQEPPALERLEPVESGPELAPADIEREARIADLKDIASGKVEPWGGVADRRHAQQILDSSYSGPERRAPATPTAATPDDIIAEG